MTQWAAVRTHLLETSEPPHAPPHPSSKTRPANHSGICPSGTRSAHHSGSGAGGGLHRHETKTNKTKKKTHEHAKKKKIHSATFTAGESWRGAGGEKRTNRIVIHLSISIRIQKKSNFNPQTTVGAPSCTGSRRRDHFLPCRQSPSPPPARQNAKVPHGRPAVRADPRDVQVGKVAEKPVHLLLVQSRANHDCSPAGPGGEHGDHLGRPQNPLHTRGSRDRGLFCPSLDQGDQLLHVCGARQKRGEGGESAAGLSAE